MHKDIDKLTDEEVAIQHAQNPWLNPPSTEAKPQL